MLFLHPDTVRRYREGLAKRIDSAFIAAVVAALGVDPSWLLMGPQSPEKMDHETGRRAREALHDVIVTAAVSYLGSSSSLPRQEQIRRQIIQDFMLELLQRIDFSLGEAAELLRDTSTRADFLAESVRLRTEVRPLQATPEPVLDAGSSNSTHTTRAGEGRGERYQDEERASAQAELITEEASQSRDEVKLGREEHASPAQG